MFLLLSVDLPSVTGVGGPYLVRFWYHMFGRHIGQLSVQEVYAGGVYGTRVWADPGGDRTGKVHALWDIFNTLLWTVRPKQYMQM